MHRVDELEPPGPSRNLSEMAPKLHRFSEPKSVPKWLPKASRKEAQTILKTVRQKHQKNVRKKKQKMNL